MSRPPAVETHARTRAPGRPRDPGLDHEILAAALELFVEHGVDGTSIEGVARRAGVGKVTVYRRFPTKEALLAAAVETIREPIPEITLAEASVAELVEQAIAGQVATLTDPRLRALIAHLFGARARHPALVERYWQHYLLPRRQAAAALLRRAKDEGRPIGDADPEVLLDMLAGAVLLRVLAPGSWDVAEAEGYLRTLYRHAGLL
ncbi:MAG: TetR/AcrR family transcriptional regulator [Pseudonocardia sp.]|nr:TetR/AcrR family transcriptional regulator [Pseudonocardia sp.]